MKLTTNLTIRAIAIGLMLASLLSLPVHRALAQTPDFKPHRFAVVYTLGPKWIQGAPVFQQNLQDHAQFETKLLSEGKLLFGGPFLDNSGGLAILKVKTLAEAIAIEKRDPAFTEGVLIPHVHPWGVIFDSEKSN